MDLKTFLEKNYSIASLNKVILDISKAAIKISNSIRYNNKLKSNKEITVRRSKSFDKNEKLVLITEGTKANTVK